MVIRLQYEFNSFCFNVGTKQKSKLIFKQANLTQLAPSTKKNKLFFRNSLFFRR